MNPFPKLLDQSGLTVTTLAQKIGAPANTVSRWVGGKNRPRTFSDVRRLTECFNLPLDEGFALFWNERVGDPCPHGWCGGEKILPVDDKAQGFDIKIKCPDCGKEKEYRGMERHRRHAKFCGRCNRIRLSAGMITLRCIDCGREKTVRRSDLRRYLRAVPLSAASESEATYRCSRCTGLQKTADPRGDIVRWRSRNVMRYLRTAAKAWPRSYGEKFKEFTSLKASRNLPKIRTLSELSRLRKACTEIQRYVNADPLSEPALTVRRALEEAGFTEGRFPYSEHLTGPGNAAKVYSVASRSITMLIRHAEQGHVKFVKGLCEICNKLVITTWQGVRVHKPCGFIKGSGALPQREQTRGRPVELEILRRHYAWLILKEVGEWSERKIAKRFGVRRQSVAEGIESIVSDIPDPELVPARFQSIVKILLDKRGHADSDNLSV